MNVVDLEQCEQQVAKRQELELQLQSARSDVDRLGLELRRKQCLAAEAAGKIAELAKEFADEDAAAAAYELAASLVPDGLEILRGLYLTEAGYAHKGTCNSKALPLLARALELFESACEPNDEKIVQILYHMGHNCYVNNIWTQAEQYFRRIISILEAYGGNERLRKRAEEHCRWIAEKRGA